jgi:hypothetical protein
MHAFVEPVEEERGVEPLSQKAAVEIREGTDDRVYPAVRYLLAQFVDIDGAVTSSRGTAPGSR